MTALFAFNPVSTLNHGHNTNRLVGISRSVSPQTGAVTNKHFFLVNQSIEAIFAPANVDEDCSRISELMAPVANAIDQDLIDGRPTEAVDLFLQLVDSLCYHFVADEHWRWFDDCYDPGYVVDGCRKRIVECLGWFPEEIVKRLREGLCELCGTEACREYGYPGIGRWTVLGEKCIIIC